MIKVSVDPEIMKNALSGLVEQLKSKIDRDYIRAVCKEQYGIETIEHVEHKDGNVVIIDDQVACRLDLEVRFPMSIFITNEENSNRTSSENNEEPEEIEDLDLLEDTEEENAQLPPIDMDDMKL